MPGLMSIILIALVSIEYTMIMEEEQDIRGSSTSAS